MGKTSMLYSSFEQLRPGFGLVLL